MTITPRRVAEDLRADFLVAASTDQLMEEYKSSNDT